MRPSSDPGSTTSSRGTAGQNGLRGLDGDDVIDGGAGIDFLDGGTDDDTLIGGAGADVLVGGIGIDTALYLGSAAAVTVNLASGTGTGGDAQGDTLSEIENVTGSTFNDTLIGSSSRQCPVRRQRQRYPRGAQRR